MKFPDESLWLLCKGAESAILPRCIDGPIEKTLEHINDYALVGLNYFLIMSIFCVLELVHFIMPFLRVCKRFRLFSSWVFVLWPSRFAS